MGKQKHNGLLSLHKPSLGQNKSLQNLKGTEAVEALWDCHFSASRVTLEK